MRVPVHLTMFFLSFMCSSHASYLCHFCLCDKWERESPYQRTTWKVNCPLKELLIFSNIDLCVSFKLQRENMVLAMLYGITSILGCRTQYQSCLHVRQWVLSFSILSLDWKVSSLLLLLPLQWSDENLPIVILYKNKITNIQELSLVYEYMAKFSK